MDEYIPSKRSCLVTITLLTTLLISQSHSLQVQHSADVKASPDPWSEATEGPVSLRVSIMEQPLIMEYYQDPRLSNGCIWVKEVLQFL